MRRVWVVSAVAVAGLVAGCGGSTNQRPSITRAVRAPLVAFMNRNATALCESFTPSVARHLVSGTRDCVQGAARAFADLASVVEYYAPAEWPTGLKINVLRQRGGGASATTTWPWPDIHGRPAALTLERSGGRWRVATPTRLVTYVDCLKFPDEEAAHSAVASITEVQCTKAHGIEFGAGPTTVRLPTRVLRRSQVGIHLHASTNPSEGTTHWYSYTEEFAPGKR